MSYFRVRIPGDYGHCTWRFPASAGHSESGALECRGQQEGEDESEDSRNSEEKKRTRYADLRLLGQNANNPIGRAGNRPCEPHKNAADETGMARIQPLLTQLEEDPSIGNLARIVREGLDNIEDETSNEDWPLVLDRLSEATVEAWEEHPVAISWEELLLRDSSLDISTRRVIVAHPILDYGDILTGRRPIAAIRAAATTDSQGGT